MSRVYHPSRCEKGNLHAFQNWPPDSPRDRRLRSLLSLPHKVWSSRTKDRCSLSVCRIPAASQKAEKSASTVRRLDRDTATHLEHLEGFVRVIQQFPERRRLLLAPHRLIDGFERLDGRRQGTRLDNAQQSPPQANPALEEGCVGRQAFPALESCRSVGRIEEFQWESSHASLCG